MVVEGESNSTCRMLSVFLMMSDMQNLACGRQSINLPVRTAQQMDCLGGHCSHNHQDSNDIFRQSKGNQLAAQRGMEVGTFGLDSTPHGATLAWALQSPSLTA